MDAVEEVNGLVPVHYTYPVEEHTLNGTNFSSAASAIGCEYMYTMLFWDMY